MLGPNLSARSLSPLFLGHTTHLKSANMSLTLVGYRCSICCAGPHTSGLVGLLSPHMADMALLSRSTLPTPHVPCRSMAVHWYVLGGSLALAPRAEEVCVDIFSSLLVLKRF